MASFSVFFFFVFLFFQSVHSDICVDDQNVYPLVNDVMGFIKTYETDFLKNYGLNYDKFYDTKVIGKLDKKYQKTFDMPIMFTHGKDVYPRKSGDQFVMEKRIGDKILTVDKTTGEKYFTLDVNPTNTNDPTFAARFNVVKDGMFFNKDIMMSDSTDKKDLKKNKKYDEHTMVKSGDTKNVKETDKKFDSMYTDTKFMDSGRKFTNDNTKFMKTDDVDRFMNTDRKYTGFDDRFIDTDRQYPTYMNTDRSVYANRFFNNKMYTNQDFYNRNTDYDRFYDMDKYTNGNKFYDTNKYGYGKYLGQDAYRYKRDLKTVEDQHVNKVEFMNLDNQFETTFFDRSDVDKTYRRNFFKDNFTNVKTKSECKCVCPNIIPKGDLMDDVVVDLTQKDILNKIWNSRAMPRLSVGGKRMKNAILSMVNSEDPMYKQHAFVASIFFFGTFLNNDVTTDYCPFSTIIKASLMDTRYNERLVRETFMVARSFMNGLKVIGNTGLVNSGCDVVTTTVDHDLCHPEQLDYDFDAVWDLEGSTFPAVYRQAAYTLYRSTLMQDRILAAIVTASLTKPVNDVVMKFDRYSMFEILNLQTLDQLPSCCCAFTKLRMMELFHDMPERMTMTLKRITYGM